MLRLLLLRFGAVPTNPERAMGTAPERLRTAVNVAAGIRARTHELVRPHSMVGCLGRSFSRPPLVGTHFRVVKNDEQHTERKRN